MNDERVRLFVALELPASVREALARWGRSVALEGLRAVRDEGLHVTLCFLGWRAASELKPIAAAGQSVASRPPASLTVGRGLWLPRRRPRVLALELREPGRALADTQAQLSRALHSGGWYEPERRPFLPHVTVARVPRGVRPGGAELPAGPELSFQGSTVTLFRSRLEPSGARYDRLAQVSLVGANP